MPDENCGKAVGFVKEHPTYGTHKLLVKNGEMMWAASDLARALGYKDTDDAIRKQCKYPKLFRPADLSGLKINPRGVNFIPESDVYRLILKSKLPKAEEFQDRVVEEVLPSIKRPVTMFSLNLHQLKSCPSGKEISFHL